MGTSEGEGSLIMVGRWFTRVGSKLGFLLWVTSLALPAWESHNGNGPGRAEVWFGFQALYWSLSFAQLAFVANPLIWAALLAGRWRSPFVAFVLAAAGAASASWGIIDFLQGRGAAWEPLIGVGVWIASMLLIAAAAALRVALAPGHGSRGPARA